MAVVRRDSKELTDERSRTDSIASDDESRAVPTNHDAAQASLALPQPIIHDVRPYQTNEQSYIKFSRY